MKNRLLLLMVVVFGLSSTKGLSQIDEDKMGAWYMYLWSTSIENSAFGFQGDIQYRNWNVVGDLEQLLLRGGLTYQPKNMSAKFTLGYGHIRTGEFGQGKAVKKESRIYQEALVPQKVGNRIYLNHRFRYEQRFVENQDFRTRWRYNLFLNIPLNKKDFQPGAVYLAFYNEIFINGQRNIGDNRTVELFDRNRAYGAVGYSIAKGLKAQLGLMNQRTDNWKKTQLQLSLHHTF